MLFRVLNLFLTFNCPDIIIINYLICYYKVKSVNLFKKAEVCNRKVQTKGVF